MAFELKEAEESKGYDNRNFNNDTRELLV